MAPGKWAKLSVSLLFASSRQTVVSAGTFPAPPHLQVIMSLALQRSTQCLSLQHKFQRVRPIQLVAARSSNVKQVSLSLHQRSLLCRSSEPRAGNTATGSDVSSNEGSLVPSALNAGLLLLWAGLMGYVFVLAPNQTPSIDSFVVQKLVGLKADDPFQVNGVFTAVWNCMGLYPLIWASILVPGGRGQGKLPAWPFAAASVFFGAYALIPYMCLWSPPRKAEPLPLPAAEMEGWRCAFMRAAETPWLPAGVLAGSIYWLWQAASAGGDAWLQYLQLFDQSRLTHATSLDFVLLTLLMPFWMSNDAERRSWGPRSTLVPLLCLLPLVGPSVYLLLRPKTFGSSTPE